MGLKYSDNSSVRPCLSCGLKRGVDFNRVVCIIINHRDGVFVVVQFVNANRKSPFHPGKFSQGFCYGAEFAAQLKCDGDGGERIATTDLILR